MYLYFERYAIVHFHGIHTSGVILVDSVTLTSKTGSFRNMAASINRRRNQEKIENNLKACLRNCLEFIAC